MHKGQTPQADAPGRGPRRLWTRVLEGIWWAHSGDLPPLAESELVVVDSVGSLLGLLPTQGRLVLTTQRLFYMPWRLRFLPRWRLRWLSRIEIRLSEVGAVDRRSWFRGLWGGFPGFPLFRVRLKNGRSYTFQTGSTGYWRREIDRLTGTAAGRRS